MNRASSSGLVTLLLIATLLLEVLVAPMTTVPASAIGLVPTVPAVGIRARAVPKTRRVQVRSRSLRSIGLYSKVRHVARPTKATHKAPPKPAVKVPVPQDLVGMLNTHTIAPGVVHKFYNGPLSINLVDIDMINADVEVRPVLAGGSFPGLADVKNQVGGMRALAAINANYFKKDGTPLGTLIIDKEWVAGPLFERVSLGITRSGYVRVDRVNLHGILNTSVGTIWVNNINQPRRTGSRLIAYTRRWNTFVSMPYDGCLVAVSAQGYVVDTAQSSITIPCGGFVLSDRKGSAISELRPGDRARLTWYTRPSGWTDVVHAVSGGPMLMKDGKLFVNVQGEKFRPGWTSSHIKARTAAGVTWNNHLLLLTIEGPHTLWDLAKFLQKLDCADAMNLDGGGSTTMIVNGRTVTRNANSYQRRVANSLAVLAGGHHAADNILGLSRQSHPPEFYFQAGPPPKRPTSADFEELAPAGGRTATANEGLPAGSVSQSSPPTTESLVDTP